MGAPARVGGSSSRPSVCPAGLLSRIVTGVSSIRLALGSRVMVSWSTRCWGSSITLPFTCTQPPSMYCSASLREQSLSCMTFLDRRSPVSGSGAGAGRCRGVAPLAGRAALRVPADSARGGREAPARSGARGWPSAGRLRSGRGGAPSRGALPVGRGCAGPSWLRGGRLPAGRAPAGRAALARGAEEGAEAGRGAGVAWRAGV